MSITSKLLSCTILAGTLFVFANDTHAGSVNSARSQLSSSQRALQGRDSTYQQFMTERREQAPITMAAAFGACPTGCADAIRALEARITALENGKTGTGSSNTSAQKSYDKALETNSKSSSEQSHKEYMEKYGNKRISRQMQAIRNAHKRRILTLKEIISNCQAAIKADHPDAGRCKNKIASAKNELKQIDNKIKTEIQDFVKKAQTVDRTPDTKGGVTTSSGTYLTYQAALNKYNQNLKEKARIKEQMEEYLNHGRAKILYSQLNKAKAELFKCKSTTKERSAARMACRNPAEDKIEKLESKLGKMEKDNGIKGLRDRFELLSSEITKKDLERLKREETSK